jgi:hypothetical protein
MNHLRNPMVEKAERLDVCKRIADACVRVASMGATALDEGRHEDSVALFTVLISAQTQLERMTRGEGL